MSIKNKSKNNAAISFVDEEIFKYNPNLNSTSEYANLGSHEEVIAKSGQDDSASIDF